MEKMLRLKEVLKIVPVSKSSFWAGIKTGIYPAGRKLSERTTVWFESDIQKIINKVAGV